MTAFGLAVCLGMAALPQAAVPELLIGVAYVAPPSLPDAVAAADFRAIRQAGYNIVVVEDPKSRDRLSDVSLAERLPIIDGVPAETVRIKVGSGTSAVIEARLSFWQAILGGARNVVLEAPGRRWTQELRALGETVGIVSRNQALFMPMRPRRGGVKSIDGDGGAPIDVKLMESPDALLIVGINHAPDPRKAVITFEPDIPEAMWQNMESGTSIDFVMSQGGPVFEHTFSPRDALVLMIRKRFR
jgi:hypothetical protein